MCSALCPAARNLEGGDGASAGRHASDRSRVRLLPQETGEYCHDRILSSGNNVCVTILQFLPRVLCHVLCFVGDLTSR